ncbi:MAG: hypothetical protein WBF39_02615 [Planococcus donghaensis]
MFTYEGLSEAIKEKEDVLISASSFSFYILLMKKNYDYTFTYSDLKHNRLLEK